MNYSSLLPLEHFKDYFHFNHAEIEAAVAHQEDHYPGLPLAALYTDLADLYQLQTHPLIKGNWADLGAGVGISALLYATLYPQREAFAIEASLPRVAAGLCERERLKLSNAHLLAGDLLDCPIPLADTFFLYFPTGHVLDRMLDELSLRSHICLVVIESHGDCFARLEKEPWLELKASIPLKAARHHPDAHIYFTQPPGFIKDPLLSLSYQQKHLLIQDGAQSWLGESFGMQWMKDQSFNLKLPARTIESSQVVKCLAYDDLDELQKLLVHLRRLGEVKILTSSGGQQGLIRKIIIAPGFSLELSSGERLKWQDIKTIHWNEYLCYESSSQSCYFPPVPSA